MTNKNKILCTGGAGFIGSHLVKELNEHDIAPTVIDDLSTGSLDNLKGLEYDLIKMDLSLGFNKFNNIEKFLNQYDVVYHLAAKIDARNDDVDDFLNNIEMLKNAVLMLKDGGTIVFASSCAVYGNTTDAKETDKLNPFGDYGFYKYIAEKYIKKHCLNYKIFRFGNVFGERQKDGLIAKIKYAKENNETIKLFNQGKSMRDYVYVKDIVRALVDYTYAVNDTYNLGTGYGYFTRTLVNKVDVKNEIGKNVNEITSSRLNIDKINGLGWKPTLDPITYLTKKQ